LRGGREGVREELGELGSWVCKGMIKKEKKRKFIYLIKKK
jgi:hypothetical protein